ncbi:hypothetical protein V8D89_005772 [Ganoderma adspersum]
MLSSDDLVLPPVQATSAGVFFGLCFSLLFYGIMLCQGRWYFETYQEDPMDLKVTVAGILLANGVSVGLIMHTCYYYAILNYLNPDSFAHLSKSALIPSSILLCISLCQYVYIRRTYLTARCRWRFVPATVSSHAFSTLVDFPILAAKRAFRAEKPTFKQWFKYKWLASAAFGCSVVGDLSLACLLSLTLHGSRTDLKRMLNIICLLVVSVRFRGSSYMTTSLPQAVFEGRNTYIIPLSLAVAKVYASATLVTLNIRRDMSEKLLAPPGSDFVFGSLSIFRRTQRQPEGSGTTQPGGGNRAWRRVNGQQRSVTMRDGKLDDRWRYSLPGSTPDTRPTPSRSRSMLFYRAHWHVSHPLFYCRWCFRVVHCDPFPGCSTVIRCTSSIFQREGVRWFPCLLFVASS